MGRGRRRVAGGMVGSRRHAILAESRPALKVSFNRPRLIRDLSLPGCHGGCNNFFLSGLLEIYGKGIEKGGYRYPALLSDSTLPQYV